MFITMLTKFACVLSHSNFLHTFARYFFKICFALILLSVSKDPFTRDVITAIRNGSAEGQNILRRLLTSKFTS
jgi:hypothetical protein